MTISKNVLFFLSLCLFTGESIAYVGPGLGSGTIAAILGIFVAIFLALIAVLYYPIKRIFKKKKAEVAPKKTKE